MNGLPVTFYTYNGTLTGDRDPWQRPDPPKPPRQPAQAKTGRPPSQPGPCGTYKKYRWHYRRGEKCEPCTQAKRAYDRQRDQQKPAPSKRRGRPPLTHEQAAHSKARQKQRERTPEYRAKHAQKERERYWRKKAEKE